MTTLRYLLVIMAALLVFGAMAQEATDTTKPVRRLLSRKRIPHLRPFKSPQQRALPMPIPLMKHLPRPLPLPLSLSLPLLLLPLLPHSRQMPPLPLPHPQLSRKLKFRPHLPRPILKKSKSTISLNKDSRGSCPQHQSRSQIPRISTHLSI